MDAKKLADEYRGHFESVYTRMLARRPITMKRKNLIVKLGNDHEAISIRVEATFLVNGKNREKLREIMEWIVKCPRD